MNRARRNEIRLQGHLIDSYKAQGGYARKWASELTVGNPDLVCVLPQTSMHLIECKHRPEWKHDGDFVYENPLTTKQGLEAKRWYEGGGTALLAVFSDSEDAKGSYLTLIPAGTEKVVLRIWKSVPYVPGSKYDVLKLFI